MSSGGFVHLYTLRLNKTRKEQRWWKTQLCTSGEVYSGSSLLADLNFQSVSGLYKNFTQMSPSAYVFLIHLIGEKISKKDTAFRKVISVQESLTLTLSFLASGDSYFSLQQLFQISKQTISCIVPEVCATLLEKLKDYIQVRQML